MPERSKLVCPVCGWQVVVYGAWEMDLMALDWLAHQDDSEADEHSAFSPHPRVLALHGHEHPAEDFVERRVS